ncbi:MAG: DNA-directed RNA polymerase subunit D [Candidatus Hydrothermarchaeaceae archaeon]
MSNSLSLVLKDIAPSTANAIRRTILAEVPTLAIEDVRIIENSSSLYDEIIAHRLGLVPIKTDLTLFNFRENCKCKGKGCPSCTLELTLTAKCNKDNQTVYSNDLKSKDKKLKPVEGIPIARLGKHQKISLEAEAVLGTGKEHVKWQPAIVGYKYYPIINIKKCSMCKECVDACPVDILKASKSKITVTDPKLCTLCNSCTDVCDEDAIAVSGDDRTFIFNIESQGALDPKEIFKKACEILEEKAHKLSGLL